MSFWHQIPNSDLVNSFRLSALSGSFSPGVSLLPLSLCSLIRFLISLQMFHFFLRPCFILFLPCLSFYFFFPILPRSLSSFSPSISLSLSLSCWLSYLLFHFLMPRFALHFLFSLMPVSRVFFHLFVTISGKRRIYRAALTGLEIFYDAVDWIQEVTLQSSMSDFATWMTFSSKDITFFEFHIEWLSRPATLLWRDWNLIFWVFYGTPGFILDRKTPEPSGTVPLWNECVLD